ncbi:MAG: COX15/CtaA family protein [Hydrotalea sp.]|nr:COX15/CtaA family protein [Hydrotalea sp.]
MNAQPTNQAKSAVAAGQDSLIDKIIGRDNYGRWLFSMFLLTLVMLVVGGLTRLTESGLSIVEWRVVIDILPPLNQRDWDGLFALYQQTEQYKALGDIFSLDDFKRIFWWEYSHRLLARLLAFVLIGGIFTLAATGGWKKISRHQLLGLFALFVLGGMQGLVGKWMVASGLFVASSVAPLNLVAHFFMAVVILFVLYTMMATHRGQMFHYRPLRFVLSLVLLATLCLGSLTAGAKAGYAYGTWPLMGDGFVPSDYWWQGNQGAGDATFTATTQSTDTAKTVMSKKLGFWQNAVLNPSAIQFHHRLFAYISFFLVYYYFFVMRREAKKHNNKRQMIKAAWLVLVVSSQLFLGILLVTNNIPLQLAALHQWVGIITMLIAFSTWFGYERRHHEQ